MAEDEAPTPGGSESTDTHALLVALRNVVNGGNVEVGVTLLVSGAWITGTLTSVRRYVDAVTTQMQSATGHGAAAFAEGWAEAVEPLIATLLDEPAYDRWALYLREATIWLPDGRAAPSAALSIRIDSVDAVTLEVFGSSHS